MARELFVGTGAWVALADVDDKHHESAASGFPALLQNHQPLVTTSLVVAEPCVVLRLTLGHGAAMKFLSSLRASPRIERVHVTADLDREAEAILERFSGQSFRFADAVSFACMRRRGLAQAFAFDRHFAVAGFVCVPAP